MRFKEFLESVEVDQRLQQLEQAGRQIVIPAKGSTPNTYDLYQGAIEQSTMKQAKVLPAGQYAVTWNGQLSNTSNFVITPAQPRHQGESYSMTRQEFLLILKAIQAPAPIQMPKQTRFGKMFKPRKAI